MSPKYEVKNVIQHEEKVHNYYKAVVPSMDLNDTWVMLEDEKTIKVCTLSADFRLCEEEVRSEVDKVDHCSMMTTTTSRSGQRFILYCIKDDQPQLVYLNLNSMNEVDKNT